MTYDHLFSRCPKQYRKWKKRKSVYFHNCVCERLNIELNFSNWLGSRTTAVLFDPRTDLLSEAAGSNKTAGLGATNTEIFSNLRFLRRFEFFSPNCATKCIFPQTQIYLRVFSQIWDFSQMCVPTTLFQPHLRNKSWDFSENVETGRLLPLIKSQWIFFIADAFYMLMHRF